MAASPSRAAQQQELLPTTGARLLRCCVGACIFAGTLAPIVYMLRKGAAADVVAGPNAAPTSRRRGLPELPPTSLRGSVLPAGEIQHSLVYCSRGGTSGPNASLIYGHPLPPAPISLVARIKTDQMTGSQVIASWGSEHEEDRGVEFRLEEGNLVYRENSDTWASVSAAPALSLADAAWHTVAAVRGDDRTVRLYADLELVGRGTLSQPQRPSGLRSRGRSARGGYVGHKQELHFSGEVQSFQIYQSKLTHDLVKAIGADPSCSALDRIGSIGDCEFEEHTVYIDANNTQAPRLQASAYDCARSCQESFSLPFFSYDIQSRLCWCKTSNLDRQTKTQFTSGPACSLRHTALDLVAKSSAHRIGFYCPAASNISGRCGPEYGRCNARLSADALSCNEGTGWCTPDATLSPSAYDWDPTPVCPLEEASWQVSMAPYLIHQDPSVECAKESRCTCSGPVGRAPTPLIGLAACKERCLANSTCIMIYCDGRTTPCSCHEYTAASCNSTRQPPYPGVHFRKVALPASASEQQPGDADSAPNKCEDVTFLRIQKTGSTSFGEHVLPEMCRQNGMLHRSFWHMEWSQAVKSSLGCVVTILRDPVERFLSEFTMMRGPESMHMEQDQWDYYVDDFKTLRKLARQDPVKSAMQDLLHWPESPSRNRQSLYILGFKRVACAPWRCCGLCLQEKNTSQEVVAGGYPAKEYSWETDHDELLARAKKHLLELRAFGFTGCFEESLRVVATAVGWDPEKTVQLARNTHARQQGDRKKPEIVSAGSELSEEIRQLNRLDNDLVTFAKGWLFEKYGINCEVKRKPTL